MLSLNTVTISRLRCSFQLGDALRVGRFSSIAESSSSLLLLIRDKGSRPSDHFLNISHKSVRFHDWLDSRLRQLARQQHIQGSRLIREEFLIKWLFKYMIHLLIISAWAN